ncbi:UDP-N-acetylmuramate dehydrogenase [Candidatus Peregrinibacteria bacterium]|nr:UDP-N-acetylmuramate dehydrogenase [Candidatus Peregrinibacteria bacterium]
MKIIDNKSLKEHNTFGIDASAKEFVTVKNIDELKEALQTDLEILILGGGSNVLFTKDFPGRVIKNEIKGISTVRENDNNVLIKAMGGEVWHEFVLYTVNQNLGGIENLSLIPGTVGAAPMQNIGAYGTEIKDTLESLEALEIETGAIKKFTANECNFGYRSSIFKNELKNKFFIISATFNLSKSPIINASYGKVADSLHEKAISNPTVKDVSDAIINIRSSKLPDWRKIGNAGSFFKNPVINKKYFLKIKQKYPDVPSFEIPENQIKIPAGWLIEKCGFRGKTKGNTGTYEKQALIIINKGNATGLEILNFSKEIQRCVKNKFGIKLDTEVNFY